MVSTASQKSRANWQKHHHKNARRSASASRSSPSSGTATNADTEVSRGDEQVVEIRHLSEKRQAVGAAGTQPGPATLDVSAGQGGNQLAGDREKTGDSAGGVALVEARFLLGGADQHPAIGP